MKRAAFPALGLVLGLTAFLSAEAPAKDPLKNAKRVVFLGDSITHTGHYVAFLEAALGSSHPEAEFINLGLPSEGVTGLSEPAHPFPRPNVHERLDRVLAKADPDVVFACYGVNDGIYHPFSEERFKKYKAGINTLIEKVDAHGATLVLLTPPPFDPLPLEKKGKLREADAKEFSWKEIYAHYDRDVVQVYAKWILDQSDRVTATVNVHEWVTAHVTDTRRKDPGYTLSGDGIHLDRNGHLLMAEAVHQALYGKGLPEIDPGDLALVTKRQALMNPSWLNHIGHKRPGFRKGLPLDQARAKAADLNKP